MYITRLTINRKHIAIQWLSNPYRVHQRLRMACPDEPRLLFRMEENEPYPQILVQSYRLPEWALAFNTFPVLASLPEVKEFHLNLTQNTLFNFRLIANPTVKRDGARLGIIHEDEQIRWLARKFEAGGAALQECQVHDCRIQHSSKGSGETAVHLSHLSVQFDGLLICRDPRKMAEVITAGIGAAKGCGFGLLSLAKVMN